VEGGGLEELRALVAQQAQELAELRQRVAGDDVTLALRTAFRRAAVAGAIVAPSGQSRLLELIVATAAHVLHADRGSLFLLDEPTQELVFEVALGEPIDEFRKLRVPLGRGIAGLVAVTGEAMAIADVSADPRHAGEVARLTGYAPRNLVCVPLAYADRIIGVIELMDKSGEAGFTPADLETLSLFATQAAVAIDQSRMQHDLATLLAETVATAAGLSAAERRELLGRLRPLVAGLERDPRHARALELAREVQRIADAGEREAQTCQVLLRGFAEYLATQPRAIGETTLVSG